MNRVRYSLVVSFPHIEQRLNCKILGHVPHKTISLILETGWHSLLRPLSSLHWVAPFRCWNYDIICFMPFIDLALSLVNIPNV